MQGGGSLAIFSTSLSASRMTEQPERYRRQMHQRSCVICDTRSGPSDIASTFFFFHFLELRTLSSRVVCFLNSSQRASIHCCAVGGCSCVPTEGCVDEHMELSVHSPTTAAAFGCLHRQMLRDIGRGKAVALLFATFQILCLANVGLGALPQCWRKRFSPRRPVCSMLAVSRISPVVPRRFFCIRTDSFFKGVRTGSLNQAKFHHNGPQRHPRHTYQSSASFPQRSTKHPRNRCHAPASFPRRSSRHPRNTCQSPASVLCWSSIPPA